MEVNVSTSEVSAVFLFQNIHLCFCETTHEYSQLRVSEIYEHHISGFLGV